MQLKDLELKHSVELQVIFNGKKVTFLSVLEQRITHAALLSPILLDEKVVGFPPGCNISLFYPTQEKVYVWHGVNAKPVRYRGKVYHSVDVIGDASTVNRRGAYRIFIGDQMEITSFTNEGPKPLKVLVKDMSESGFSFFSYEQFEIGRTIRLNLNLGRSGIKLPAQIVRKQQLENHQDILYGCRFSMFNTLLSSYLMKLQQQQQKQKIGTR